jgi:polysaccharide biosynthesis/export protein VpsN
MRISSRLRALSLFCIGLMLQACTPPPGPLPAIRHSAPTATPAPEAAVGTRAPTLPRSAAVDPLDASVYQLSSGDVVRIDVLGEGELSLEALIDTSGYINYPFLGQVFARGLTIRALQQKIHSGLSAGYLVSPDVRVTLKQYRPVFVGGQVRQSGAYPYALGLTVEQALTLAGGMTTFGSPSRIFLQRWGSPGGQRERVDLNTRVFPGDTIVVEERFF